MESEAVDWDPEDDEVVRGALEDIGCEAPDDLTWLNLQDSRDPSEFEERGQEVVYRWSEKAPWGDLSTSLTHWIPYPPGEIMYFGFVSEDCDVPKMESGWVRPGPPIALYWLVPAADSDISKEELLPWLGSDIRQLRESARAAAGEVPA